MKYPKLIKSSLLIAGALVATTGFSQSTDFGNPKLTHYLNKEKTRYIAFSGYAELWARYSQLNPGTTVNGEQIDHVSDLSLRRIRAKMMYKPTENLLFVLQMGPSNVNVNSKTNTYMDLLDAYAEYSFSPKLQIGGGRSTWRGLSRYTTGPLNTLMYDLPAYATSNTGISDIVVREMSIYAKGQLGKFDYRLVLADPYTGTPSDPKMNLATYSKQATKKDVSGYFRYAFFDTESNASPFNSGTYQGSKHVLSVGAGFDYTNSALWHKDNAGTTVHDDMQNEAVDIFYEQPFDKEKGTSLTAYGMAMHADYGPNYVRYNGANNPGTGVATDQSSLNGSGITMPIAGTGNTYFAQVGTTLPYLNKKKLQLQPAVSVQYGNYEGLKDAAVIYDAGISLLLHGNSSKFTLNAENRPIFNTDAAGAAAVTDHKWAFVLKYRIDFN